MLLGRTACQLARRFCVSSEMLASISILHSATTSNKQFKDTKDLRNYLQETTLVSGKNTLEYLERTDRKLFADQITLTSRKVPGGHGETTSVVMQGIILDILESTFAALQVQLNTQKLKILDVGCGTGTITFGISHMLKNLGMQATVVGVDLDGASIKQAQNAKQFLAQGENK